MIVLLITTFPLAAQNNTAGEEYAKDDDPYYGYYFDDDDYDDDFLFDDWDDWDDWFLVEGEGLTVFGSPDTTQQLETINRETIENTHAPDLPSLLEETLGLGVTRYGPYGNQAGINIRGFDAKRITILVDGIPVNSTVSDAFDFYSIDPLSVEKIEVIHGGSDTKFNVSGALGGVINIITVKKNKPGWSIGGSFANTSYIPTENNFQDLVDSQNINLYGAYGAENYSLNISVFGNRAGNHFLYKDYFGSTSRKEGNEILDAGATVSYIQNIGDYSKIIASGSFYYGDKNIPVTGYASNYAKQRDMSSRENFTLDMPRAFHDDFSMELSLGHNWSRINYIPGGTASLHDEHTLTLINRWVWYSGTDFILRFGGDYRFISLDSTDTGLHYGHRGGIYTTAEYSPNNKLLLIASVKGMTDGHLFIPVPKFGLSWTVNDSLTLKNNYFRSFKFPDFNDLYWVQSGFMGNPDLNSEEGWGTDISMELSLKNNFTFNSTLYGQWTEDSIHWDNSSGTWRPENSGTAVLFGWDNSVDFTIPVSLGFVENPVINISWLFQLSWLLNGNLTFNDNKRIPYMPIHTLGISLELPWKTVKNVLPGSLIISGHYESIRYANTANTTKLDPVFLLTITFNQKLNNNIGIFGKINNVLNTDYVSYAGYPMPGINLVIGVNMVYEGNDKNLQPLKIN